MLAKSGDNILGTRAWGLTRDVSRHLEQASVGPAIELMPLNSFKIDVSITGKNIYIFSHFQMRAFLPSSGGGGCISY